MTKEYKVWSDFHWLGKTTEKSRSKKAFSGPIYTEAFQYITKWRASGVLQLLKRGFVASHGLYQKQSPRHTPEKFQWINIECRRTRNIVF